MSSSVTVWTSSSTALAQSRVAQIISATRVGDAKYDNISIAGLTVDECKERFNSAFNRLVSLSSTDSTLHVLAVVPMYEDNTLEQLQKLSKSYSSVVHRMTLHIIGLAPGIRPIFDIHYNRLEDSNVYSESVDLIKSICGQANVSISYSLIDAYAENGAPIGFTVESLSHYIALFQIALMRDYYKILSPALLTAHQGDNLAIGVSSLSFNRSEVAQQILGLGFLAALDNVGINNREVDAQKAARESETFLAGISGRYPHIFERSIRPLYKENGMDEGRVVARAADILDNEIKALKDDILSLLGSDNLTLPEKEAVLAMILGRDNENIRGMQYEHDGALLDDACEQPINIFVEAFNKYCRDTGYLPVRGDFDLLKNSEWNGSDKTFDLFNTNSDAFNPLPEIKKLKQEIINTTAYLRDKQDELSDLQRSDQQRKDVERMKSGWQKPKGNIKDVEYKEQPLDKQYSPASGLIIMPSVDMRKFFTPVKNQMELGSCTSFAAVAMFEAMMRLSGVEGPIDMSPAYLYFYSNILKGKPSGGSNFFEQLEVLGTHGVCSEALYKYDADKPQHKPSDPAEEDAKKHRVLSASQIPLINGLDKPQSLKHNHSLLTSALSEGYPIGISLKIYDYFGKDGAFIFHPDDVPDAKEDGWHAMVIVGYSEENNFYIVRNSWGSDFGEDGYCYVPTAYIDDPEYMDFACIITEISDNAGAVKADVPSVLANFAATETQIRIAAIRNVIAKVRVDLKNNQKLYAEYYKYYQRLVMQLSIPQIQNNIRSAAERAQTINFINVDVKKRQLEDSFVDMLKEFKKQFRNLIVTLSVISLGLGIVWYFSRDFVSFLLFIVSTSVCVLTFLGYKWWIRIKRRELQEELDQVAIDARNQAERLFEMQMRFHIAGMWLLRFHDLSLEIGNYYDRLVSFNNTLCGWQELYSGQIRSPHIPDGEMFGVLDASPLLNRFFEQNRQCIVNRIDLSRIFDEYNVNQDDLERSHQRLKDSVSSAVDSLMSDFSMANFLLGDEYQYLTPVNIEEEISRLINLGQPSYRNLATYATAPVRILFADIVPERAIQWSSTVMALFPMPPLMLPNSDPTSITLLTIHPQ